MKVVVSYLVLKEVEMELTETMFRELYNKHKDSAFVCSLIENDIYDYLEHESGYHAADGQDLQFDAYIEDWVRDMYEKIDQEE